MFDFVLEKKVEKIVVEMMNKILSIYKELGEEYEWENEFNFVDYEMLKKVLMLYVILFLIVIKLKSIFINYYCKECNMSFFFDVIYFIWFEFINNYVG